MPSPQKTFIRLAAILDVNEPPPGANTNQLLRELIKLTKINILANVASITVQGQDQETRNRIITKAMRIASGP